LVSPTSRNTASKSLTSKKRMNRVEMFSGEKGLRSLEPAWRSLTAQPASMRHFHRVEWYLALAATFETHGLGKLQCFAAFSDRETLAAILPMHLLRKQIGPFQLNAMRLVSDHSDNQTARDFVMSPGLAQTSFFQGFVRFMADNFSSWDVIELPGILEDSYAAAALKHCPQIPHFMMPGGAWGRCEFISCGDGDYPFERLSKGFRQNLRTAHNKLKPGSVSFESARTERALLEFLPELLKVESSGWKGELGTSVLKTPPAGTFMRKLISHFGPIGGCEIHLMRTDNASVAALFGIVTDKIWYIFLNGYDEAYHRISPGHLIIENLLAQRAPHNSFDVLTPYNAPPWFRAWKPDKTVRIFDAYLFRPSAKGVELARQVAAFLHAHPGHR
jgi:CelD/BcsL family acetyltransferase involved in cellulose biosynthesis